MTFRLALRSLLRSPVYAAASVGTIALTIALAASVFAIVDGVLFKPLPYPDADRLFTLTGWDGRPDTGGASVAALDIKHLSEADPRVHVTGTGLGSSFTNPDRPDLTFWTDGIDRAYFYQIDVHEPMVFAAAAAVLSLAVAIAAWIPARRASAVDPVTVLRADYGCAPLRSSVRGSFLCGEGPVKRLAG